jgi:hypothetical protein
MAVPAPSPASPQDPVPANRKRGRRVYAYWAIGLALLVAAGLACWAFVVPYFQARSALDRNRILNPETMKREVARLGCPAAAARKLRVYLMVPDRKSSGVWRRLVAVHMLEHCGKHGVGSLVGLLDVVDGEPPLGSHAATFWGR